MPRVEPSPFVIGATQTWIRDHGCMAAASFARCRAIHCSSALDPAFLATLSKLCRQARFVSDVVEHIGHRELETPNLAGAALTLALNRANLMQWIEETTQCGPLKAVGGHVVQTRPVVGDQLSWHNDLNDAERCLAITINLSEQPYAGGLFELGVAATREVLLRHRHVAPGSALLFEVAPGLVHRVLPLTSGGPRRIYTGWFLRSRQT